MSSTDRVWELMKKIGICMLASWDGQELQARPMGAYVRPDEHAVFFLADARHHKDEDIRKYRKVCLAFADTGAQNYVSVAGDAEILDDRSMIRELWGIPAKAWWNSPDDPNIRPVLGRTRLDGRVCKDGRCSTDWLKAQHGREPKSGHEMNERDKPKQNGGRARTRFCSPRAERVGQSRARNGAPRRIL